MANPLSYDQQKQRALSPTTALRVSVAKDASAASEILYFLAQDKNALVRQAVLENPMMPQQALIVLAKDPDDAIRTSVAQKIASIINTEEAAKATSLSAPTVEAASTLVRDPLDTIRSILSEALKFSVLIPKSLLKTLARDVSARVAKPVIEHSPQFVEADFVELLEDSPPAHVYEALARRRDIGENIMEAIIVSGDDAAAGALLENNVITLPIALKQKAEETLSKNKLAYAEVEALARAGKLNDAALMQAISAQNRPFVEAALAVLCGLPFDAVKKVLQSRSAKALTAMCWKAGIKAVTAYHLQLKIACISPASAVAPENGGYSLTPEQLDFHYGVVAGLGMMEDKAG